MTTTKTGRVQRAVRTRTPSIPKLRILSTPEQPIGNEPPLVIPEGGVLLIGRSVPIDEGLCIADERASRCHAALWVERGEVMVEDRASKNGTFVNRSRVTSAALGDGDILQIGDSFFSVRSEPLRTPPTDSGAIVGKSAPMGQLRADIKSVGRSVLPVLLLGESGTGKEVAAQALHAASGRRGPLVAVNCTAIPETLAESLLFGQVAGAYTGASAQPGFFRAAETGTLFLDEVGDLSANLQPKLLRALESGEIYPVGATRPVAVDVRIIAATNQDLTRWVHSGRFRGDLFTRLAGSILVLPPLRERREDILPLARHFYPAIASHLTVAFIEKLLFHDWKFNVRELKKVVEELEVRGDVEATLRRLAETTARTEEPAAEERDDDEHSPSVSRPRGAQPPTKEALVELLQAHRGVIRQVSKLLGCSARQLGRWLALYDLDIDHFRNPST